MKRCGREKRLSPPNDSRAITPKAKAPRTNMPTTAGLTLVFTRRVVSGMTVKWTGFSGSMDELVPAMEELHDPRVAALGRERARIALGDDAFLAAIEHDDAVGDAEDRGELVRNDHQGGAKRVAHLQDQFVQLARCHRVETGRWLVEENDRGIQREGARKTGALLHA